jgi:hypothetical protein
MSPSLVRCAARSAATAALVAGVGIAVAVAAHPSAAHLGTADCFTVTVTNTPLHPAPRATVCLPIDVPR